MGAGLPWCGIAVLLVPENCPGVIAGGALSGSDRAASLDAVKSDMAPSSVDWWSSASSQSSTDAGRGIILARRLHGEESA